MQRYRRLAIGQDAPDAVTVGIERAPEGGLLAAVWWPAHDDVDGDETTYASVEEALAAAEAARELHGFSEVVVTLQSDDIWNPKWGEIDAVGIALDDGESFELARATEAMRDA
jgi:hypothetical protein